MSASYDSNLGLPRDRVRRAVGDVDMSSPLMQDEEYDAILSIYSDELEATAAILEGLAAQYANRPQSFAEAGGVSIVWGDRAKTWLALASQIRTGAISGGGAAGEGSIWSGVIVRPEDEAAAEYVRPEGVW